MKPLNIRMKGMQFPTEQDLIEFVLTDILERKPRASDQSKIGKCKIYTDYTPKSIGTLPKFNDYALMYDGTLVCVVARRGGIVAEPFFKADFSFNK